MPCIFICDSITPTKCKLVRGINGAKRCIPASVILLQPLTSSFLKVFNLLKCLAPPWSRSLLNWIALTAITALRHCSWHSCNCAIRALSRSAALGPHRTLKHHRSMSPVCIIVIAVNWPTHAIPASPRCAISRWLHTFLSYVTTCVAQVTLSPFPTL